MRVNYIGPKAFQQGLIVVGNRFHCQNRLSESKTDSIIEVTLVLGVLKGMEVLGFLIITKIQDVQDTWLKPVKNNQHVTPRNS